MQEAAAMVGDEEGWKCRKHPSRPRRGVCPYCLRDRLLHLCPECARDRPCACSASCSSSSSSSSFSSLSSADLVPRHGVGAVGRVAHLIESEPAFRRSRSAALPFLRRRSDAEAPPQQTKPSPTRGWGAIWPFGKTTRKEEAAAALGPRMARSRSVAVERLPLDGGGSGSGGGEERGAKGRSWHFPSPMKAFWHRKSARIVHERSPICRG